MRKLILSALLSLSLAPAYQAAPALAHGEQMVAAVQACSPAAIRARAKAGDAANDQTLSGYTLVGYATTNCDLATVHALFDEKADLNAKDEKGRYPIFLALNRGRNDIAMFLIKYGADLNARDDMNQTPLMVAIKRGNADIIRPLVNGRADINTKDQYGNTPLVYALKTGQPNVALKLIELGADRNARDAYKDTALLLAINKGYDKVALALINGGADTATPDQHGHTPLVASLLLGKKHMSMVLVKRLADVNTREPQTSQTPLMMAVDRGWYDVVKAMLEAKADPNLKDNHSKTALMFARAKGHTSIANLLIKFGATS